MTDMPIRTIVLGALCLVLVLLPTPAPAQGVPDEFKNLKVLPENIDRRQLVPIMRQFASGLGVRCWFCHVGEEGKPLSTFDFASDEKQEKRVARDMMRMVNDINGTLAKIDTGHDEKATIGCATCHHGLEKPRMLQDILEKTYAADGLDATLAKYEELRAEYYGGYAYDFGQGPLNMLAETLGKAGKDDEALRVQLLNASYHPDATYVHFAIGEIYRRQGDTDKAIEAYQRAVEADPDNSFAAQRIEELKKKD